MGGLGQQERGRRGHHGQVSQGVGLQGQRERLGLLSLCLGVSGRGA